MTFLQLFTHLNENTPYDYITVNSPLAESISGKHENPLIAEVISTVANGCDCKDIDQVIERQNVIKALGPLRLKYMKDDAPVEGFRFIQGAVPAIDLAFNDEALKSR